MAAAINSPGTALLRAGHGGLGDSGVTPACLHSNYTQLSKKMAQSWQTSRAIAKSQRPRNKETCGGLDSLSWAVGESSPSLCRSEQGSQKRESQG